MKFQSSSGELRPHTSGVRTLPVADGVSQTILLVDHTEINLRVLKGTLRNDRNQLLEANDALEALQILGREKVDLIIADLMLAGMGGLEFCRRVKAAPQTRLIPLLLLTSVQSLDVEVAGLESGADEFLIKPVRPSVLRGRVDAMLRAKRTMDSLEEAGTILFSLAQAVEARDKITGDHCERLASLSVALGSTLGLSQPHLQALHQGGYLHDIGKIAVPDAVLFKNGRLDEADWALMKGHPAAGEQICRPMKSLGLVLPIIRHHHERWDGSGYPDKLGGEEIPILARILQLADIYDALTSVRQYKPAFTQQEAIAILRQEVSQGWRDPDLTEVFIEMVRQTSLPGPERADAGVGLPPAEQDEVFRDSLEKMRRELLKEGTPLAAARLEGTAGSNGGHPL
ncbi:MAG: response regulator [Bryobacterales bacterium]|nr:response regulator [Bryobacterales bacterium]